MILNHSTSHIDEDDFLSVNFTSGAEDKSCLLHLKTHIVLLLYTETNIIYLIIC